jgi:photosystem II stability/assembly factor-like uncharacterized protein
MKLPERRVNRLSLLLAILVTAFCAATTERAGSSRLADSIPRQSTWKIIGPGGGGAQFIPTISPHDSRTVLVACDMTGAYITRDGGQSWREFNLRTRVDAFAFDPSDPKVIYAGASGLFRSDDGGERWRLLFPSVASGVQERMVGDHADHSFVSGDNWPGGTIQSISIDPNDPAHIFIAIRSPKGLCVFSSSDRGLTWKEVCQVQGAAFRALYLDPTSPPDDSRLFIFTDAQAQVFWAKNFRLAPIKLPTETALIDVACGINSVSRTPVFYLTAPAKWESGKLSTGVWRSTDCGQTWLEAHSILDQTIARPGAGRENNRLPLFTQIACSEGDARTVYLAVQKHPEPAAGSEALTNYYGIVKSDDGGATWRWVLREANDLSPRNKIDSWVGRDYGPEWGEAPLGLGVSPTRPDVCYATDFGTTYCTTDGGKRWDQVYADDHADGSVSTRGLDVTTCYGVHFDPFDNQHLAITYTDIGLFHSLNGGGGWRHAISGVPHEWRNTCYWVVFDPEVKNRAWSVWGSAHDLPRPKMFRSGNFDRYVGGVCRTDDGLKTWQKSNNGMPENTVATHILLDPRSPVGSRTLYVAGFGKGVFKSTDDGRTWKLKNNGVAGGGNLNAWRIVQLPDGMLYLLIARGLENGRAVDGAIYQSTDGAEHWQRVSLPAGVNAPNDLTFDANNPKRMYLACWPKTVERVERFGGLYVTEDGGRRWNNIFDSSSHAYGVTLDQQHPSTIFINTFDSAAYRSDDGGKHWHRLEGYNFKWGHRVILDPHHPGRLYLTTFGSSVWCGPTLGESGAFEDVYPFTGRMDERKRGQRLPD